MANDFARTVADGIIEQLKRNTAPWQRDWKPGERIRPYNPTTENDYRGGNSIWLMAQGRSDPRWMTYKQAEGEGAQVRKGETGTAIQIIKTYGMEVVTDATGAAVKGPDGNPLKTLVEYEKPRVMRAVVFNAEQIDGLQPAPPREVAEWDRHQAAENILAGSPVPINHYQGDAAYYDRFTDQIVLPERDQFPTADGYYVTALHELGHATGHPSRLDRDMAYPFGSEEYAREELRAEIASMMVGTDLGIGHDPSKHAAYLSSWIKVLENDPQEIFRAARDAEKIAAIVQGYDKTRVQIADLNKKADTRSAEQQSSKLQVREGHSVMTQPDPERTYLAVPYAEKDQAKALGAKWDRTAQAWYALPGADLAEFSKWQRKPDQLNIQVDPEQEFAEAIRAAGMILPGLPQMDGMMHRVGLRDDAAGKTAGAYVGYLDGHPGGYIHNWKTGERINWKPSAPQPQLSEQERADLAAQAEQKRQDREVRKETMALAVASTAASVWNAAVPIAADHPYLVAKGIAPGGLRMGAPGQIFPSTDRDGDPRAVALGGRLLAPMRDIVGKIWNIQTIDKDGVKGFQKGGRVLGCFAAFGDLQNTDTPLLIAEGVATAAEIHSATQMPVVAAMNAANIAPVAHACRVAFPDRLLIIAGDNDHLRTQTSLTSDLDANVGRRIAEAAAEQVGGYTLLPDFAAHERGTDWNDFAKTHGIPATVHALASGIRACQAQALEAELHQQAKLAQAHSHELTELRQEEAYQQEVDEQELVSREAELEQSLDR